MNVVLDFVFNVVFLICPNDLQGEPYPFPLSFKIKMHEKYKILKNSLLPYFCMCLGLFNYTLSFLKFQTH